MADFNGKPLWSDDPTAGALLYLSRKAPRDARVAFDGAEVELTAGSAVLTVRGLDSESFDSCLEAAVSVANRALDIAAVRGWATTTLRDPSVEHILWILEDGGPHLRLWCASDFPLPVMNATITVQDAEGNIVQSGEPETKWHESFRYFRLAQATDDLFDAFRNLYLAVEAILSTIAPQHLGPSGRPSEGEGAWFKRALGVATAHVELAKYSKDGVTSTAIDDLFGEIYERTRTAVFHAKAGRPVLIPMDRESRPAVMDALTRLAQFFVDLSAAVLGARYGSSFWATGGFHMMADAVLPNGKVFVTGVPQDTDPDALAITATEDARMGLDTRVGSEFKEPFLAVTIGEVRVADLISTVPVLWSAVLATQELQPALMFDAEGALGLQGFQRLTVILGIRGRNTQMLRMSYGA